MCLKKIEVFIALHSLLFHCSTFTFQGLRIDEALRLYLEAFRLPGEAPVIQRLLETFTDNWHVRHIFSTNGKFLIIVIDGWR